MKKRRTLAASPRRAFWGPETPRPISFVSEARCKQAQRKVLLSFARHGRCKPQSFPSRHGGRNLLGKPSEMRCRRTGFLPQSGTGMTGVSKGIPSQMTPRPTARQNGEDGGPASVGRSKAPRYSRFLTTGLEGQGFSPAVTRPS